MKGISVIIPNYNGRILLEEVLPNLYEALSNSGEVYEIIISDDASKDDSLAFIRSSYPDILLLINEINSGFSPTINKGIFKARYDYLLLLNSDVKLTPDYFSSLFKYFEDEDTFGVMGKIVGWNDDNVQDGAKYPNFHGAKIKTTGNYLSVNADKNERLYSMYLSGANSFVSRDKIWQLGGFDELFAPFYVEDYELSLRAWRMGWKCFYDDFSVCRHKESVSIKSANKTNFIKTMYYRNKMFLHAIHLTGFNRYFWYLQMPLEVLVQTLIGKSYHAKALKMFMNNHSQMLISRKKFIKLNNKEKTSVQQVVKKILESLKNKKIIKF
ncbi:MAG: glycosyltransferase family 2 protein [Ferruginibacter sp.]